VIVSPTFDFLRWSRFIFVPTEDSSVEWSDSAISVAMPSIHAARTGVARTWRVPEPTWAAVWCSFTV